MRNNKLFVALGILGTLLFATTGYAADYWTGDGGRGKSLAIYEPKNIGLPQGQTLTTLVQGYFATTLGKYSAIDVQNRMRMEELLKQAELQNESSIQDIGEVLKVDYLLIGDITRTSSAFVLNIDIYQTNRAMARHSGTYTLQDIEDGTAVNKATLDLLGQMGVTLTALARAELQQAAPRQTMQGQTALAQGIVFGRNGVSVEGFLYYQANEFDPSLMEAVNRASIASVNIRTGNIGQDRRTDIQWRNSWQTQLSDIERYFDTYFKTFNQPYALIYTPELQYGTTNYRDETVPVSFMVELLEQSNWTNPIMKFVNDIWYGLNATGRKTAWGFENWPRYSVSNVNPFRDDSKRLTIAVELVNEQNRIIARQTFEERGRWTFSFNQNTGIQSFTSSGEAAKTITFPAVKASDLTEGMTLRFTTVNGVPVANASRSGLLMITPRALYRDAAGFDLSGYDRDGFNRVGYGRDGYSRAGYNEAGYDRDGFNRAGYGRDGYSRAGYNEAGYDRAGYTRSGFDKNGFNKEGYTIDGSLYNMAGYDRDGYDLNGYDLTGYDKGGYDKKGYDKRGYKRSGYRRWSPVSSYLEGLYTFRRGGDSGSFHGLTIGLFGVYGSLSFSRVESDEPTNHTVTVNGETTYYDVSLGEFVVGYTLNLLPVKKDRGLWGLGVPLGAGRNNIKNQLVLETGLQLRFLLGEIRGTYRTMGFKENSFTISAGFCLSSELFDHP
ncbi:MAG: hypothetical protein LBJ31_10175 [Treponema sp.]|jgi:hypothetical protein|nr:hypothetical protein [Treponema sp.]